MPQYLQEGLDALLADERFACYNQIHLHFFQRPCVDPQLALKYQLNSTNLIRSCVTIALFFMFFSMSYLTMGRSVAYTVAPSAAK